MGCEQPFYIGTGEGEFASTKGIDALCDIWLEGAPCGEYALPLGRDLRLGAPRLTECTPVSRPILSVGGGGNARGRWGDGPVGRPAAFLAHGSHSLSSLVAGLPSIRGVAMGKQYCKVGTGCAARPCGSSVSLYRE